MRKLFLAASAIFLLSALGLAQDKTFQFYYIAHDRTTPVNDLCKRLQFVYDHACEYENSAVIFYLPNYDQPFVVRMNLPDSNPDDFSALVRELRNKSYHEIYAESDFNEIMSLIDRYDFVSDDGRKNYASVLFCWYVNPEFWRFGYAETILASVYFCCEFDKYKDYVTLQIWHADGDGLAVNEKYPFGKKNLCAGLRFIPLPY